MMKSVSASLGGWVATALAVALLCGGGGCRREEGTDGRFKYTAGPFSAELAGLVAEKEEGNGSGPERLVVPNRLGGKRVGSVAARAFWQCTQASSIKIPWHVSRIGAGAFAWSTNLVWAELPSRLTRLEDGLFFNCSAMVESDIPERVTEIGSCAYYGCTRLERVVVPAGLRSVGDYAFSGCSVLERLDLPEGVAEIGAYAFDGCRTLESFELPPRTERIPAGLFANCLSLGSVGIPPGVRDIGESAFYRCKGLRWAPIPPGVTNIGAFAFFGCQSLEEAVVPAGVQVLPRSVFEGCAGLANLVLPEGVTAIGDQAFRGCASLPALELPAGVTNVGIRAFEGCESLESLRIPAGVASLPAHAFAGCRALRSVVLPAGLGSIAEGVFAGCSSLEFLELPQGLTSIPDGAFEGCSGLRALGIPAGVTNVGARAFAGCVSLEQIELPEGLQSVGEAAFEGCAGLESVTVPAGVVVLDKGVFAGCGALAEVRLAPGLEEVRENAFGACSNLAEVSLPETVRTVHPLAFAGCSSLGAVKVAAGNPVFGSRNGVLFRDGGEVLVLFPAARGGTYSVPEGVLEIGPDAFRGSGVETVRLPDGVGVVGESAFRDCSRLQRIRLGEGLREIREAAFMGCSSLQKLVMPASVGRTGRNLFAGCGALRKLVVPDEFARRASRWKVPPECAIRPRSEWEGTQARLLGAGVNPFYGLYADEDLETVTFEGTVLAASAIPDPAGNDYDNCLYALFVDIDSVLSASEFAKGVERVVLVNVPVMKDKAIAAQYLFREGDKISCTCAEYDDMPQDIQEIQLSDDIQSFEHRQYYALTINKVAAFRKTGNKDFAKREISILPIRSLPRDPAAAASRRERIRKEMHRIEKELERHGGSFGAWKEEYKDVEEKYGQLCGEGSAGWTNDCYFAAGGTETGYMTKEYIEGILPYKKFLEANNIDLIVVRVPSKWDFAARVLASGTFRENPAWVEHYYECLKNDIEIVDPMPEMWKARFAFPLFYFYNEPEEFHPFEGLSFVAAKKIASVLKRYPYQKSARRIVLADASFETDQPRYFWPPGNEKFDPGKNIVFKEVLRNKSTIGRLEASSGSPFVFLSNSWFWYPQRLLGASVPGYTAHFLQAIPDWFYQDGVYNPMLRNLVARSRLLDSRRAVIMVGDPDNWKGFPPVPKYIQDHARRITLEKTILPSSGEAAIHDGRGVTHSVNANESVSFVPDGTPQEAGEGQFDMVFKIPSVEGKNTCMVRVNFEKTSYITLKLVRDGSDVPIDTCSLAPGGGQSADLFVPLPDRSFEAKVIFQPRYQQLGCSIQNIELWYY